LSSITKQKRLTKLHRARASFRSRLIISARVVYESIDENQFLMSQNMVFDGFKIGKRLFLQVLLLPRYEQTVPEKVLYEQKIAPKLFYY